MVGIPRVGRRRRPIAGTAACAVVAMGVFLGVFGCSSPELPPKNIVLITIDTLRADHLAAYGYPRGVSPYLDDLARRSVPIHAA